jgi:methionine synthase II (cobalamin-independent)
MIELEAGTTTGIGSLPHHNIDAALEFALRFRLPFLPQIPIRNPWEFAVAQALEGMPGIRIEHDGSATVDTDVWAGRMAALNQRLLDAFSRAASRDAFESFEPSAATASSWQPFLWELEERGSRVAKIQTAGPLTSQWALRLTDGSVPEARSDLSSQIYRLVLARALGMSRRLQAGGVLPVLYLDEPALYVFNPQNPRHVLGLQELKITVQALRKENVVVGLHCCSNIDWSVALGLGLDILSLDTSLSLPSLLQHRLALEAFLNAGGRLSLGIIPTAQPEELGSWNPRERCAQLWDGLSEALGRETARRVLSQSLLTPACGLALHTPKDAEIVLELLNEAAERVKGMRF